MELYTAQMGKWRILKDLKIELVDITAKSGLSCFAPEYHNVMKYKNGELSEEIYTHLYVAKMRHSYKTERSVWLEYLKRKDKIAFCCYCKPNVFCHRLILKDIFQQLCVFHRIQFNYHGEVGSD